MLAIEDIHWADRSTRDFLTFLARNLCASGCSSSRRSHDELHRRHPLRPLLAGARAAAAYDALTIERLTPPGSPPSSPTSSAAIPDAALVERLYARCEGNPLFAEELLAAGGDGRGELPPTLRDALMVRVETLAEPTQELLRGWPPPPRRRGAAGDVSGLDRAQLRGACARRSPTT